MISPSLITQAAEAAAAKSYDQVRAYLAANGNPYSEHTDSSIVYAAMAGHCQALLAEVSRSANG